MRMAKLSGLAVGIVLLGCARAPAVVPQVSNFKLSNGIRVVSLHIPDSKNVSIFTFSPMGLACDGPGRTQWSHLVSHLAIRSTMPPTSQQAKIDPLARLHPGNRGMTWDINARHLVLTWPIPAFDHADCASLMVAGRWLMMKFFSDAELKKLTGITLAGADLSMPEGNFSYISASIKPQVSFDDVRKRIDNYVRQLGSPQLATLPVFSPSTARRLSLP